MHFLVVFSITICLPVTDASYAAAFSSADLLKTGHNSGGLSDVTAVACHTLAMCMAMPQILPFN
jgi:hypothetical protein